MALFYINLRVLLFAFFASSQEVFARDTLELVQILWRHGDRSPTHPFPTDVNNDYWTDGNGQLTNIGKQQHYALGQYLRTRYDGFLNASYNHNEVHIRSTDVDRTLMSAYCNLAGLYPPQDQQVWNVDLLWQPIPVHTKPEAIDYVVNNDAFCPKYYDLMAQVKTSPQVVEINQENQELYTMVRNETGYPVIDFFSLGDVYDALFCDKSHDLSVPDWVAPVWDNMTLLRDLQFYCEYGLPQLSRLRGGPLLGNMIDNINNKINGMTEKQKAFIYSSHDSMLVAFLSAVGIYNNISPPYASTVIVELLRSDVDESHSIQIFYRNDTSVDPYLLTVPNCTSPCPLDEFVSLTAGQVPEDILKECELNPNSLWKYVWSWSKYLSANSIFS